MNDQQQQTGAPDANRASHFGCDVWRPTHCSLRKPMQIDIFINLTMCGLQTVTTQTKKKIAMQMQKHSADIHKKGDNRYCGYGDRYRCFPGDKKVMTRGTLVSPRCFILVYHLCMSQILATGTYLLLIYILLIISLGKHRASITTLFFQHHRGVAGLMQSQMVAQQ